MKRFHLLVVALLAAATLAAQEQPKVYMVANAHMDTQWRWTIQRTIGEYIPNTLLQNFALMEQYPDYVFNFEGADKYAWAKEYYPEQFEKLKGYVANGQWHVSGGSWDANDHNMPSVESCIRNYLQGHLFYKEEFGIRSVDVMLPDCFGFGATLPSIASHCGLIGFATQKLHWRARPFYENGRKIPFRFGIWEGIDGSRIMAVMDGEDYFWCPDSDVSDLAEIKGLVADNAQYGVNAAFRYFGTRSSRLQGDQGGSPTPLAVSLVEDAVRNPKDYAMHFAGSDEMMKDYYMKEGLPVFKGELLMDIHATGCYTSHSEMKRINRVNEGLLTGAESAGVLAEWTGAMQYPSYTISESWKRVLSHQFHDDLTGTSIPEVYQFSYSDEFAVRSQMETILDKEMEAVSRGLDTKVRGIPVVVWNPVSGANKDYVRARIALPKGYKGVEVYGPDGKKVASQLGDDGEVLFAGTVPSLGMAVYDVRPVRKAASKSVLKASGKTIQNRLYSITLNDDGDICSLIDKRSGKEMVRPGDAFSLLCWDDNWSGNWPAWEIFKFVMDREPGKVNEDVSISVEENGPLRASLRVERRLGPSVFVQHIRLTDGAMDERIDVLCEFDWQSRESLLKASFPTPFEPETASYDLGMAHINRGVNTEIAYEVYAHGWADLSAPDGSAGLTIMNDGKYGWDHPDAGTLRLTLLHTPKTDRAWDTFQTSMDLGKHSFTYSLMPHGGKLDAAAATFASDCLNKPKRALAVEAHSGVAGKQLSIARSTNPSLKIGALKKAERGDEYVVRVYELSGKGATGRIEFPVPILSAQEVDGVEESKGAASFSGNALMVDSKPFQLRTFKLKLAGPKKTIPAPQYSTVELPYNTVAISSDAFSAFGHMDGIPGEWRSYAAEILPNDLVFAGIPFRLAKADLDNAVRCAGQELAVPEGTTKLYLLAASSGEDKEVQFGDETLLVENWTGKFGAYGWQGVYDSFCRSGKLAYMGTHSHGSSRRNLIYECSYMYLLEVPVVGGSFKLPDDKDIVVFAATACNLGK